MFATELFLENIFVMPFSFFNNQNDGSSKMIEKRS